MPVRTSEATWRNGLEDGDGEIELGSGAWRGNYSYRTRVDEEDPALSNPEELLAASHAGCFAMALANRLEQAGHEPEEIHATARCHLDLLDDQGPTITRIDLETDAEVPGIDPQEFRTLAQKAKRGCPVSRALAGVDISLEIRR